ncbi:Mannan endo-1,6-alpha-mannosidase DCW1, partial [Lachnellula suecica]
MRALKLLLYTLPIHLASASPEQHVLQPADQHPLAPLDGGQKPLPEHPETFPAFLDALDVLQADYFAIWQGLWPTGIDWTSAVIGTHVSASLSTLSSSFSSLTSSKSKENLVNKYFSQLVASYFGQDAFALRQEAYDDILWVVLGWVESIKFINQHNTLHYKNEGEAWYGTQWIPAFAHRARLFWNLASQGWDTSLCSGGMIWSPWLEPYKNAITNELYIAASISMYLYFPGDENTSPFSIPNTITTPGRHPAKDPKYLAAAVEAYKWLNASNMTDAAGLYVDGYHITGYTSNRSRRSNTRCDARNEMVYTYNQGVLLTGQRGLYEATGARSYLSDGHALIRNVISATGFNNTKAETDKWQGLGRNGIMEESCDAPGYCSQDGQTFKGIFFHHLTAFCARLPDHITTEKEMDKHVLEQIRKWHDKQCASYVPWIRVNARAALGTRDEEGRFGMWWGAPSHHHNIQLPELPDEAVDYRNLGVPAQWKEDGTHKRRGEMGMGETAGQGIGATDLNSRGRGRT